MGRSRAATQAGTRREAPRGAKVVKRAQAARSWDEFSRALFALPEAVLVVDSSWTVVEANPVAALVLKSERTDLIGRAYRDIAIEDDFARARRRAARYRREGQTTFRPVNRTWRRSDGKEIDVQLRVSVEPGPHGDSCWVVRASELATRGRTEALLASVVASVSTVAMVSLIDSSGEIRAITPDAAKRFGYEGVPMSLDLWEMGVHVEDRARMREAFARWMAGSGDDHPVEYRVRHGDGSWRWVSVMAHDYLGEPGVEALVVVAHDITEQRRLQTRGAWQLTHDTHTGLINFTAFVDRIRSARLKPDAGGCRRIITCLELPGLRPLSDTGGPEVNRRVLRGLARRVRHAVPKLDLVARTGEVSLVTLHEGVSDAEEAMAVARSVLSVGSELVNVDGVRFGLAPKVGLAVDSDPSVSPETLIGEARAAASAAEPGTVEWYDSSVANAHVARHAAEAELRRAVEAQEMEVVYQPVIDVVTGLPWSLEALLRWRDPSRGLVSPDEFVSLLEDTGLIHQVGLWILEEALGELARWQSDLGAPHLGVSVNVSARQLADRTFPERVQDVLKETAVAPETVCLEVTESVALDGHRAAPESLAALDRLGCTLAVDDFGAGYASLSRLAELPFDVMKIDRSLVRGLLDDSRQEVVVGAALGMAVALGLDAIAEGVEEPRQLRRLRNLGCHLMQGYLYARPSPAPIMTAWLEAHGRRRQRTHQRPPEVPPTAQLGVNA
jgi:PAS domain S-box-containing protein